MIDHRCSCGALIGRFDEERQVFEVKCRRCKQVLPVQFALATSTWSTGVPVAAG